MSKVDIALEYIKEQGRVSYENICINIFKGDESSLRETIAYLKETELIKTRETDQQTLPTCFAVITDKGMAKVLLDKDARSEKRGDMRRDIIGGTIIAVISAVITLLVERLLF